MKYLVFLLSFFCTSAWAACVDTCFIDVAGTGIGDATGVDVDNQCAGPGDADCTAGADDTQYWCGALTGAGLTLPASGTGNTDRIVYDGSCPGGTKATITATSGTAGILANKNYVTVKNMHVSYAGSKPIQINGDDVVIEYNTITAGQDGITLTSPQTRVTNTLNRNSISGMTRYAITMNYTGASTNSYTDLAITDNYISGNSNSGIFIQCGIAAVDCTITRLTIDGNTIKGSANTQLVVQDCYDGADTTGTCADPQSYTLARFTDVSVTDNIVTGSTAGGGISVYGCTSSTNAFGKCKISGNTVTDNLGPVGCVDIFNSRWITVEDSYCARNTTETIDANGILVDYGNKNVVVRRNQVYDNVGLADTANSGVGIMVIRGEDVDIYGNVTSGNRTGFYTSGGTFTEARIRVFNNTFADNAVFGWYIDSTQEVSSVTFNNNIVTGPGICINAEAGGAAQTEDYNVLGCLTRKDYTDVVAWTDGTNTVTTSPVFVGGPSPNALAKFELVPASVHRRTGLDLNLGNILDCNGRAFNHPPDRGGCGSTSGSLAKERTLR